MPSRSAKTRRLRDKQRYANAREEICTDRKHYYMANADMCKSAARMAYSSNPEQKKEASKIASKLAYADSPDKKKEASKIASKLAYADNPDILQWVSLLNNHVLLNVYLRSSPCAWT